MNVILKAVIGIASGALFGALALSARVNYRNYQNKKYQEDKDLRRRGINPKERTHK